MEEENGEPFRVFRLKRNPTTMHFSLPSRSGAARKPDSKCPSSAPSRNASFSSKHSVRSLNTSVCSTGSAALAAKAAWRHEVHQSRERQHAAAPGLRQRPDNQPAARPPVCAAAVDHLCGAGAVVGAGAGDAEVSSRGRPRRRAPRAQQQHVFLFGATAPNAAGESPTTAEPSAAPRQQQAEADADAEAPAPARARSCPPLVHPATSNQLYGSGLAWQAPALAASGADEEANAAAGPAHQRGRRRAKRTAPRETGRRTQSASQIKRLQMLEGSGSFW